VTGWSTGSTTSGLFQCLPVKRRWSPPRDVARPSLPEIGCVPQPPHGEGIREDDDQDDAEHDRGRRIGDRDLGEGGADDSQQDHRDVVRDEREHLFEVYHGSVYVPVDAVALERIAALAVRGRRTLPRFGNGG
jgi:hypothetical protein